MKKYRVNTFFFSKQIAEAEDPNRDCSHDFLIENGKLIKYIGPGGDVVVPEGVRSIGDRAFSSSLLLTSIRIPDCVTEIGKGVFQGCSSLRGIHIPGHLLEGMTTLGAMSIFTEEFMNYPSTEAGFIQEILSGTDDYSEGFRDLLIRELRTPFGAQRWVHISIRDNRPDWVQKILDLNEDCPPLKLDDYIEEAAELGRAEIVTRLLNYQQKHKPDNIWELPMNVE